MSKNKKNKTEKAKSESVAQEEKPVSDKKTTENKEVKTEVEELKEALEKEKERNLRLFAEFENYKKRTTKERMELFKTAGQEVLTAMLPIVDDFDRAVAEINKSENPSVFDGILLINNKFRETLKSKGLTVIDVKTGDIFNADNHEAITQIPAPTEELKGKIIDVVEKGYSLGDKILRYPKVVIGQ